MIDKKNFITRSISGFVLVAIFLISIFIYRPLFSSLMYIIAALMLFEWYKMTHSLSHQKSRSLTYLIFYNIIGIVLIAQLITSLLTLSELDKSGWILMTMFTCIAAVDTMAMIGGKTIGGPKLAPRISPNKTVSGLFIGVLSAIFIINIMTFIPNYQLPNSLNENRLMLSFYTLIIGILGQCSDLLISFFKRKFQIKDTGSIIPGHGGVLDRFDGMILVAPLILLYLI